ncbi:MAG: alpha/beta fold hydrolase [Magnetococcus sp. DMHC-6]
MMNHRRRQTVVLIHGLWMNGLEMGVLGQRLRSLGYRTLTFRYPTVRAGILENASRLHDFIEDVVFKMIDGGPPPHLVCHSLGGMVALNMLEGHPKLAVGRVVALGTPFLGSQAARHLADWSIGRLALGNCMEGAMAGNGLQRVPSGREVGIIAGALPIGLSRLVLGVQGESDGTVAVEETRLPGAKEHITLRAVHVGLVFSPETARLVHRFLSLGTFGVEGS